jgi:hypothetical protein
MRIRVRALSPGIDTGPFCSGQGSGPGGLPTVRKGLSTDPLPEQRQRDPPSVSRNRLAAHVESPDEVSLSDRGDAVGRHLESHGPATAPALQVIGAPRRSPHPLKATVTLCHQS